MRNGRPFGLTRGSGISHVAWACLTPQFPSLVSLIAALACALPSYGRAQGSGAISGTVTAREGQPLSGVVVAVRQLGISVATSATGRYLLSRVPAGEQVVQFRRVGYAPRAVTVTVTAGTPITTDVVLDPRPIELGAVVVEGVSRAPDRVMDAPAAVDVVPPGTTEAVSITGQVPLALARMPGLDVAQGGVTDFNVNARGFNTMLSRKMLVLQDGRDLGTAFGGQEIWGALSEPLEDLGRIEVIRGPGSTLYGANAYNGVINITTPAARDVVGTKLSLGGGELGTARADLRQAGVWLNDRFGYRLNLGYTRSDDWTRSRTAKDGADWIQEYAPATSTPPTPRPDSLPLIGQTKDPVTGRALGTPDPVVSYYGSARVDYYAANRSIVTFEGGMAQLGNSVSVTGSGRNQSPRLSRPWARVAWDADGSGVSAWYSGLSMPLVRLTSGDSANDDESVFHFEGHASRTLRGGADRVVVGASVQDNTVNTNGTLLNLTLDDRSDQYYGAFAQLEYGMRQVRVLGAVRWDDSDIFPAELSPKGALIFSLAKRHALRLTVDRSFLTPNLATMFDHPHPAGTGKIDLSAIETKLRSDPTIGPALDSVAPGKLFDNSAAVPESTYSNPHLVPQTMTSYEIGYRGQFSQRVFITLDAYDAHIANFLTGLLPAGTTGVNPDFNPWTAPSAVPPGARAAVEAAALRELAARGITVQNGLTRMADGTTAVILSYGNAGKVEEWGVELGGSVSATRALTVSASYTWYRFAVRDSLVGSVLIPNTPQHKGTVALDYAGSHGVTVGVDARITSGFHWRTGTQDGDVPASQIVNLSAGYRIGLHLRVYAYAANLLDQQRFQIYGGPVIGRRVLAGVTSTF